MRTGIVASAIFLGLASGSAVLADNSGNGWYGEGNLGYGMVSDSDTSDFDSSGPTTTNGSVDVDDDIQLGFAVGYHGDWGRYEFELLNLRNDLGAYTNIGTQTAVDKIEALSALFNFWRPFGSPDQAFRPYVGFGLGVADMSADPYGDLVPVGQIGVGVDYRFAQRWVLDSNLRYIVAGDLEDSQGTNQYSYSYDAVLLTIGVRRNRFDSLPLRDSDSDGVSDRDDECSSSPSNAEVNNDGCSADADGDGVVAGVDICPDTPAGEEVNERGCSIDADGDGVVAGLDECPETPTGTRVDHTGCSNDEDGDGVANGLDTCPNTPASVAVLSNGCGAGQEWVMRGVNFESDRIGLSSEAQAILDGVASAMKTSPGVVLELQGHTDDQGAEEHNAALSKARADEVKDYLVSQGIRANRLQSVGYGETLPLVPNSTAAGREENRRVTARVLRVQ